jgi:cyclic-di-GMP-binding protein
MQCSTRRRVAALARAGHREPRTSSLVTLASQWQDQARKEQTLAESFFDIVSRVDHQEVDNALNQTAKEISTRFDFRGVGAGISWSGDSVEIRANSEERAKAVLDVFKEKLIRRGVSLKAIDAGDPKPSGKEFRLGVSLKQGISQDDARKISKLIRDDGPKGVRAQVQGEELRVSSKKKDDLQAVIALVKGKDFGVALQFVNFR